MTTFLHDPVDASATKRRVTVLGLLVNIPLALVKIVGGAIAGSPALVADGVHSLADLLSDGAVLWALGHSARAPDAEHPYGHGRFETLATLLLAALLMLTAAGIAWDAAMRLMQPAQAPPGILALWIVLAAIAAKEALFHITHAVARRTGSTLIAANAWHHRSDAITSIVALVGIGAALGGVAFADPLAAGVIALMLGRIGWRFGRGAADELVDTQAPAAMRQRLVRCLQDSPGVEGLRALRMRRHGARMLADVSILVDPQISVTEGHRIAEATRKRALADCDALEDMVIHVEPADHYRGFGATDAPLRAEIEALILRTVQQRDALLVVDALRLGYFDDGLEVELVAELARGTDQATEEQALHALLAPQIRRLRAVRLLRSSGTDTTTQK